NMPLHENVSLEDLAEMTEGFSGADLENLCREAAMAAVRDDWKAKPVEMKHFEMALKEVRPSISPEDLKRFEAMAENVLRRKTSTREPTGYV
ncbi:MAG: AAA family ATPase, partial [Candidatus Thorarchaeota archaeon]